MRDAIRARLSIELKAPPQSANSYINEKQCIYVNKSLKHFCEVQRNGYIRYVELLYDEVANLVMDLENKRVRYDLLILRPGSHEALLADRGVAIESVEVRGRKVFPIVDIGHSVFEGSKLCYAITRKYEVVVVRSPVKGTILYIGETFLGGEPATLIVIIGEKHVIRLTRSC